MSLPLLRTTFKRHWLVWLLFFCIMVMYLVVIAYMYDPATMQSMDALLNLLPKAMIDAFGFQMGMTTLTGFIVSYFFGFLAHILALFYTLLLSGALVAKLVDNGSMAYLLTTPTSRGRIIVTQMFYLYTSLLLLFILAGGVSCLCINYMFPGLLDVGAFLRVLCYTLLVSFAVASFCMLCSCLFSTNSAATGLSTGVAVGLLLLQMMGSASPSLSFLQRLTPYGWMPPASVMNGAPEALSAAVVLLVLTAVLSSIGYVIFTKKQLAI